MSILGIFKAQSQVGTFKFMKSDEGAQLRRKVEKMTHSKISDVSWQSYCELRALREIARKIEDDADDEFNAYDILWDEFYDAVNPDGSSKFGLARVVEHKVHEVDPWA